MCQAPVLAFILGLPGSVTSNTDPNRTVARDARDTGTVQGFVGFPVP